MKNSLGGELEDMKIVVLADSPQKHGALDMLLSVACEEKIVHGSDFPHSPAKVVLTKKKHLDENPKYQKLLLKIYGENEKNCLGI